MLDENEFDIQFPVNIFCQYPQLLNYVKKKRKEFLESFAHFFPLRKLTVSIGETLAGRGGDAPYIGDIASFSKLSETRNKGVLEH